MPKGNQSKGAVRMNRQTLSFWVIVTVAVLGGTLYGQDPVQAFLGKKAPEVTSQVWINSDPLSQKGLNGKVVLVEFRRFFPRKSWSCIALNDDKKPCILSDNASYAAYILANMVSPPLSGTVVR